MQILISVSLNEHCLLCMLHGQEFSRGKIWECVARDFPKVHVRTQITTAQVGLILASC